MKKNWKKKIMWVAGVCSALALAFFLYNYLKPAAVETVAGLEFENATLGILPGIDLDARQKELQEILDKSMIAFSINTNPTFADGEALGNLMIENPENNAKLLVVEVYLDLTKELVYKSKAIKPGYFIEEVKLDTKLSEGTYPATAFFKGYTEDTQEFIGQAGMEILLHIMS